LYGPAGLDRVAHEVFVHEIGGALRGANHTVGCLIDSAGRGFCFWQRRGLFGRDVDDGFASPCLDTEVRAAVGNRMADVVTVDVPRAAVGDADDSVGYEAPLPFLLKRIDPRWYLLTLD
jgi:hypothetical protein